MKNYIMLSTLLLMMSACGSNSGFSPSTAANNSNTASGTTPTTGTPSTSPGTSNTDWNNFSFTGSVSGGSTSGFQVVSINTANKTITISLPLPFDASLTGLITSLPLPQMSGATLAFTQLTDGTPVLTVTLPLVSIAKGVTGLPTSTLPSGQALPGMPANAEPSEQVQVGKGKIPVYVYVGQMSVGLFVNTPFDPTISTHFQIVDPSGNSIGGVYSIPYSSAGKDGGFFINVNVPAKFTQLILNNI